MANPEPGPSLASAVQDLAENDLERLMNEAREAQLENPVEEASLKPPNLLVWAMVAALLVLISIVIHFFWPAS
ncbi:hypothetical protein HKD21_11400 [Gluconobacter cerevisiae]|uniref:Uncharacterized protein n=1 Tax=Gluconobacter cerevisiae TaxID=1379734 RepID=A0ABR9YFK1_9PROT|nr:hypothetical protein [Gluconobacter cerevisiae]MBF0877448.1 hypothetical protein [Gluconobacter cerevisiae]